MRVEVDEQDMIEQPYVLSPTLERVLREGAEAIAECARVARAQGFATWREMVEAIEEE